MINVTGVTVSNGQIREMTKGEREASRLREAANNLEEKL